MPSDQASWSGNGFTANKMYFRLWLAWFVQPSLTRVIKSYNLIANLNQGSLKELLYTRCVDIMAQPVNLERLLPMRMTLQGAMF